MKKDKLLSSYGEDVYYGGLKELLDGLEMAVDLTDTWYKKTINLASAFMTGSDLNARAIDEIREQDRRNREAFEKEKKFQNMMLDIQAQGEGPAAEEARKTKERRRFNQSLVDQGLTGGHIDKLRQAHEDNVAAAEQKKADEEARQLRAQRQSAKIAKLESEVALLESTRDQRPNDYQAYEDHSMAKERLDRLQAAQRVDGIQGLTDQERRDMRINSNRIIARDGVRDRANKQAEINAQERAARIATARLQIERLQSDIEIARAKGMDKMADRQQIALDHARSRLDLEERTDLSLEQRARRMEQLNQLRAAKDRSASMPTSSVGSLHALAGGNTLIRQIMGLGGSAPTRDDPVARNTAEMLDKLDQLVDIAREGGGAVVAVAG